WDTAANWSLGHVPGPTEDAVFNSTSSENCLLLGFVDVRFVFEDATYAGRIIQTNSTGSVRIRSGGLTINGAAFTAGSGNYEVDGDISIAVTAAGQVLMGG